MKDVVAKSDKLAKYRHKVAQLVGGYDSVRMQELLRTTPATHRAYKDLYRSLQRGGGKFTVSTGLDETIIINNGALRIGQFTFDSDPVLVADVDNFYTQGGKPCLYHSDLSGIELVVLSTVEGFVKGDKIKTKKTMTTSVDVKWYIYYFEKGDDGVTESSTTSSGAQIFKTITKQQKQEIIGKMLKNINARATDNWSIGDDTGVFLSIVENNILNVNKVSEKYTSKISDYVNCTVKDTTETGLVNINFIETNIFFRLSNDDVIEILTLFDDDSVGGRIARNGQLIVVKIDDFNFSNWKSSTVGTKSYIGEVDELGYSGIGTLTDTGTGITYSGLWKNNKVIDRGIKMIDDEIKEIGVFIDKPEFTLPLEKIYGQVNKGENLGEIIEILNTDTQLFNKGIVLCKRKHDSTVLNTLVTDIDTKYFVKDANKVEYEYLTNISSNEIGCFDTVKKEIAILKIENITEYTPDVTIQQKGAKLFKKPPLASDLA